MVSESDDSVEFTVTTHSLHEENDQLPPLRNPPILEAAEDLTSLSYLNEPAVLHAIKIRYSQLNIYTYSGIVLIATNPFQRVDQLYSQDIIQAYAGKRRGELDPHLFAIAEDAYRCMKTDGKNQTIVVSGESGAGKTVSAKYIMRYFALVEEDVESKPGSSLVEAHKEMLDVEKQILATNPIMEAFGNAKTTRNDNSLRFGKYLEILFDSDTAIVGARIRTYLLERSRLVFQPKNERNYHIFYQVLAGMSDAQKAQLSLETADDYRFTNQGGSSTIDGLDDADEFKATNDALALIGINADRQFEIYKVLAALLHIGNIQITATRNDAFLASDEPNLVIACDLLGIDPMAFSKWCVKKQITTRSEKIVSNLSHAQALVARDSFAKYIYSALFDWLVDFVNSDLCPPLVEKQIASFIGVLDIYGFEHFEKNSFEQFCINYANEKLQQEFNQHVFKLEQEEYVAEEIEWSFIDFADNQPCISLIESRMGVLALLDEESRLPAGNDQQWIDKMFQTLDKPPTNAYFKKPRFGQTKFTIAHYALDVTYDMDGFIEKNRDTVGEGHMDVMNNASNKMLQEILSIIEKNNAKAEADSQALQATQNTARPGVRKPMASKKPTLGSMFKNSLIELMATINSTNAHYIRCIKPNEEKKAWEFDSLMVLSQLRACGVLETIRISCAGFPSRWTYVEFADRYHILVAADLWMKAMSGETTKQSVSDLCSAILQANIPDKKKYQLGNTKIFFKAGLLAHFEKLRADKLYKAAVMIQKNIRRHNCRKQYLEIRQSIVLFQAVCRGKNERARLRRVAEAEAATLLQTLIRSYLIKNQVKNALRSIVSIQRAFKGVAARRQYRELRTEGAAITLQKTWRGAVVRREHVKNRAAAVKIQSAFRRKMAYRELSTLKADKKSVSKLQKASFQLENKVIDLTQSLTAKVQENKKLISEITDLRGLLQQQGSAHEALKLRESEYNQNSSAQNESHQQEIAALNKELESINAEYVSAEQKIAELTKNQLELKLQVQVNLDELSKAKEELLQRNTIEVDLKTHIEHLKSELANLQSQQRSSSLSNGSLANPKIRGAANDRWAAAPGQGDLNRPVVISVSEEHSPNVGDINDTLFKLLRESRQLHSEIVEGLLKGLKIPQAGVAADLSRKEVLFPARIIIIILSDMWRLGLTKESEEFLGEVLSTIQIIVSALKEDDVIAHGAFWLSNTHELYSFVSYAEETIIANDKIVKDMGQDEFDEYLKLVAVVKEDFESLSYNIYNLWMKKIEKEVEKKAISAVVLHQSLPGFMAPEISPFLSKVFSPSVQYKMDDILSFFNSVYWSMKSYFIEQDVLVKVIVELLRFIDALCFNDLIMRRNFLSWKRGLQLNYNVTRLEEWCKSHDIPDASVYLHHLLQAAKLLQLRKNTAEDIEIIYDICYALKPVQVQKLISQYHVADYETPIAPHVLQLVAEKVKKSGSANTDELFELVSLDGHFEDPFRLVGLRPFSRVEAYVPAWLTLPVIRRIVELVARNAAVQDTSNLDMNLEQI